MIDINSTYSIIYASCGLGLIYAAINFFFIRKIQLVDSESDFHQMSDEGTFEKKLY